MIVLWVSVKHSQGHHPVIGPSLIPDFVFLGPTRSAGLTRTPWQERFSSKCFKSFHAFVFESASAVVPVVVPVAEECFLQAPLC